MTGLLLQIGVSKLIFSFILACGVWIVHRRVGRCAVSYPLWLLVLAALLAPAVFSVPVFDAVPPATGSSGATPGVIGGLLAVVWLLGTAFLLAWTLLRAFRFQRTLRQASNLAPPGLQREAAELGRSLSMRRIPEIHTTRARVSPMVWWTGGRVRVLIPRFLLEHLERDEVRAVLAHELAHARRRDYLVRWLEWLACSVFWWNPVAWWARRQLRIAEEWCCDALGVAALKSSPRRYARSLLRAIELMSQARTVRAPAFASAADRGSNPRTLRRRLEMIMARNTTTPAPRWLRTATWIAVVCALPFGMLYCGTADDAEGAAPADEASDTPTPLAWSDEEFLNADAAELAEEMLAELDIAAIRAEHGSLGAYLEEGLADLARDLREEVDRGDLAEETAERFSAVAQELVDQLVARVDSRTLTEDEALNQFVYGFVRVFSVAVAREDGQITDEEAVRRIDALQRELRDRENGNREYAALSDETKEAIEEIVRNLHLFRDALQKEQEDERREYAVRSLPSGVRVDHRIFPIIKVKMLCGENGNCKPVDSLRSSKDIRHDAAAQ